MKNHNSYSGMTLVELLVSIGIMSLILLFLVNYFSQGSRIALNSEARGTMQQEILNAQQLISGKLKEAWYIYPETATITLDNTNLTKNLNGNSAWNIATDPILAMILPPIDSDANCVLGGATDGCYRFLAYYPMKRSQWISNLTSSDSWRNPGADNFNSNQWILAEYRANMFGFTAPTTYPPAVPPTIPTNGVTNILSDYIAPANTTGNTYTMFDYSTTGTGSNSYVNLVTISLASSKNVGNQSLRLPNATDEYTLVVSPSNLGKVAAN